VNMLTSLLAAACLLLGAGWWVERSGWEVAQAGYHAALAQRAAQVEKANADALLAAAERDAAASEVVRLAHIASAAQMAATINEGKARAERIRTVTRTVEIPAACPVGLPDSVRSDLAEAVSAAQAAGRRLRAGSGAGDTARAG